MLGLRKHDNGPWNFVAAELPSFKKQRGGGALRVVRVFNLGVPCSYPQIRVDRHHCILLFLLPAILGLADSPYCHMCVD